jgi:type IV pilus assembly protein PilM
MATQQPGVWGIDLGLCALKAIRLEYSDNTVRATAFDYIEHPKILSQPDADPDQLTREALEQFLSRNNLKGDKIVISVAGQSGLARFVKLPPVQENKIADIVKFEAKQQIPFPLDEVVWDFQKIGTPMVTDGLALETEIGLFAMKKDNVNRALAQFKDVDVEVHIIQMAPLALINYIAYDCLGKNPRLPGDDEEEPTGRECVVALDIGTDNSNLVITDGERIIWQRAIPLGGNHFTRALTKDMKLTFAKAEHLKRNAIKSPDLRKILASLKSVLSDFVGEVQRSLGYFTNTHRDAQIKYMVGLGGAFRLPGLQKFLQEKLQLEVRKISKFDRLKGEEVTISPQFNENILSFAVPYGLALQGLKLSKLQTNLLPHDIRMERLVRAKKPWAAAAAAALLVAVAGLTYGKSVEKTALTGPEIDVPIRQIAEFERDARAKETQFKAAEAMFEKSTDNLRRLVAGVDERFNWQLMAQFINMTLPQADGKRLPAKNLKDVPVRERFFTPDAIEAFKKLEARRVPNRSDKLKQDPAIALKDDEFIKKHLVQISIEGIHAIYCDDFSQYFRNISQKALKGMSNADADVVKAAAEKPIAELPDDIKKKIPEKAWIVEIRGYTYHHDAEEFIKHTLLENLRHPDLVNPEIFRKTAAARLGNNRVPETPREKLFKEQILDQIGFLFLYKNEEVPNPEPGNFAWIKGSYLPGLVKNANAVLGGPAPGAVNAEGIPIGPAAGAAKIPRDNWKPIGEIASMAHASGLANVGAQPIGQIRKDPNAPAPKVVVEKQARREFVVLFVWKEPLRTLEAAVTADAKKD